MNVLVTGGAGYIGSFMVKRLLEEGYVVTVFDSLEKGHKETIDERAKFVQGSILDKNGVESLFARKKFDGIIHFAGLISMGESMEKPGVYFETNTLGSLNVIEQAVKRNVKNFIFSSTAGVYGNPNTIPIPETHPKNPTNPYGASKLMVEDMLSWYHQIHDVSYATLRYFNAAGAALDGSLGENHSPETHIIPNVISSILKNSEFTLYGDDYDTPDRTCVRDYIHVLDLVEAHILSLKKLQEKKAAYIFNVGTGNGYSNKEVIDMVEKVSGKKVKLTIGQRRPGDAESLIADPTAIKKELGFEPKHSDLKTITETAWNWHKNLQESGK